ncbi:MAG: sigma-70 family RNA polymerase sigma factor [Myxococcales bacterium]|nr:sigma-70 family RNA polymerase sigma factor [Myxococcales bacterium]
MPTAPTLPEYSTLYREVRHLLRARARGLHKTEVDDISQNVMEKIVRADARGKGPSRDANAWVKQIARNEHINWIRRRSRGNECSLTDVELSRIDAHDNPGATVLFMREVDDRLTPRQREVVRMFSCGYTGHEIADALGLSQAMISLEKRRIREALAGLGGRCLAQETETRGAA